MDGILLDTERVYTEVTQAIVARFGKTYDWSLKSRMIGLRETDVRLFRLGVSIDSLIGAQACELLVKELDLPMTPEEYRIERKAGHQSRFPHCKPLPGVMRLVSHLKKHGIPIAVATSSFRDAFELKSKNNQDLFKLFDGNIVVGNDPRVVKGKPAPDIFQAAARQIGNDLADPRTCLVFEDSPSGVHAALNAGMQTVWIPDANLDREAELVARCDEVLASMEAFVPEKYGLPPFDD
nr:glutathione synthase [Polyrhizophydium stewartii]